MSCEIRSMQPMKTELMSLSRLQLETFPPSHQVLSHPAAAPSTGENDLYLLSLYQELSRSTTGRYHMLHVCLRARLLACLLFALDILFAGYLRQMFEVCNIRKGTARSTGCLPLCNLLLLSLPILVILY